MAAGTKGRSRTLKIGKPKEHQGPTSTTVATAGASARGNLTMMQEETLQKILD